MDQVKFPEGASLLNEKQFRIYTEAHNWIMGLPPNILALVKEYECASLGNKTVVCTAMLVTGYEVTAYSAPVDIQDFNLELGRILAKKKVLEEIISLERYYKFNLNHSARHDTEYNKSIIAGGLDIYHNMNEKGEEAK